MLSHSEVNDRELDAVDAILNHFTRLIDLLKVVCIILINHYASWGLLLYCIFERVTRGNRLLGLGLVELR